MEEGLTRKTWYYYDAVGNRVLTIRAPEGVWNGVLGSIATIHPQVKPTFDYFDELNRLVMTERRVGEESVTTRYTYDPAGNRSSMTDPNGALVTYEYYRDNLLKAVHYHTPEGVKTIHYTYDAAGNRVRVEDPTCITTYTVDPRNRVTSETKTFNGASYTVSYRYDAAGNLTGIGYPGSAAWVEYRYDQADRLKGVSGFTTDDGFRYDPSGIPVEARYANGTTTTYRLDPVGRIELLETVSPTGSLLELVYGYDPVGNIISLARDGGTGRDYRYNKADELIREKAHGFTLPTPLPAGVDKTTLGNGQTLRVTLNWDGTLVYENLYLVTRLVGYEAAGGLVLDERIQRLGSGEMPSQVELVVPADSFYSGQAVVTVGLMDGGGNYLALLGGEQVGSGNYIVARGITLTGSVPAGERAPGDTLGGRLSTMSSTPSGQFVDCNELLYQDNSEKFVPQYEEVLIKSFRFTKRNNDHQKIRLELEVRGEHYTVALFFHYWSQGHLRVYLDGNLMGEYVGTSVDRFDTFSPVYDISGLPDGEHLLEFKLFKTGDSAYFWNIPMYGINRKCEVWLVRKQLTRHTFESPIAATAKPIRGVILTTSSTDAKQQEALAETV
ncbi:MAG: hypothetical protein K6U03_09535, partial [Firmicutes bacterium]|nr:hypothetical protein [Bacillota bacterium]